MNEKNFDGFVFHIIIFITVVRRARHGRETFATRLQSGRPPLVACTCANNIAKSIMRIIIVRNYNNNANTKTKYNSKQNL